MLPTLQQTFLQILMALALAFLKSIQFFAGIPTAIPWISLTFPCAPKWGLYIDDIKSKQLPAFFAGESSVTHLKKYSSKEKSSWLLDTYQVAQTFEFKGSVLEYYTLK